MWDNVVIGTGTKTIASAFNVKNLGKCSISHNRESFWVSYVIGDLGMTIFKDTKEGKKLESMLNDNVEDKVILEQLQGWFFGKVSVSAILKVIEVEKRREYERGRRDKCREILGVLGIDE